jgi:hypothetical protein
MSTTNRRPLIDSNVPVGPGWFDYLAEEIQGDDIVKLSIDDGESAIQDPIGDFIKAAAATRFDSKSASTFDSTWNETIGGVVEKQYHVGGELLGKSEITSRMLSVLGEIRAFCRGDEAEQIEKAIRCLDFALFGELAEPILSRMKVDSVRTLVPTAIGGVTPTPGVTVVPRAGQRPIAEASSVPAEFAKLVSVENTQYDE